jgi:hypothetical protein
MGPGTERRIRTLSDEEILQSIRRGPAQFRNGIYALYVEEAKQRKLLEDPPASRLDDRIFIINLAGPLEISIIRETLDALPTTGKSSVLCVLDLSECGRLSADELNTLNILIKKLHGYSKAIVGLHGHENEQDLVLIGATMWCHVIPDIEHAARDFLFLIRDPRTIGLRCPFCSVSIRPLRSGRYRCTNCDGLITVSECGEVNRSNAS